MIIEFIGTPGSGKTTLLPTVVEVLGQRGLRAYSVVGAARPYAQRTLLGLVVSRVVPSPLRRILLWQVFYHLSAMFRLKFSVKHPRLIWHVLISQKRRPMGANVRQRRVLHWFFHQIGYYEFLTTYVKPNEALVFDEGFIHRVVQLNASDAEEPRPAQIFAYVDLLPQPDLVIFAQTPPEVCEKRIYHRGIWEHFRCKNSLEMTQYIAHAHSVVNLAVDHVRDKGWRVIEVDNGSEDLNASHAELRRKLMEIHLQATERPENLS